MQDILSDYDYSFPSELIAQEPATPRDSARLLVYHKKTEEVLHDTFLHLADYVPPRAVLVMNETKVVPARLPVQTQHGGRVNLLYLRHDQRVFYALADRALKPGQILSLGKTITFTVEARHGGEYALLPSFAVVQMYNVLERWGITPLPPYIKNSPLAKAELKKKYQSVFARHEGSVAAPTASLHFTPRLMKKLRARGIAIKFVTLHVNLGTFASLTPEALQSGKLHHEEYRIDATTAKFLEKAKREGRPIIAVGTTVVRTLESAVVIAPADAKTATTAKFKRLAGSTDLFIQPGYRFKMIDGIITNFHVPRSSLMMLVAAFIGRERLLSLYEDAIRRRYQLFSFGDGMLLL